MGEMFQRVTSCHDIPVLNLSPSIGENFYESGYHRNLQSIHPDLMGRDVEKDSAAMNIGAPVIGMEVCCY